MKVIELRAQNFKRLRAIDIKPDGNVVVIAGRNAQGKSSVLDSIWSALAGGAAMKGTTKPIRDGEEEASVELDLGDFIIRRTWKEGATNLVVMSKDGAKYPSPQKFLDEKLGALSFDPLAFAQQDEKTQLKTLLELVKLPFDPDALAGKRATLYATRTEAGREARALEGQLEGIPEVPEGTPEEPVSARQILDEQVACAAQLNAAREHRRDIEEVQNSIDASRARIEELESLLETEKANVERLSFELGRLEDIEVPYPADRDFASELEAVESINAAVRARSERERVGTLLGTVKLEVHNLTEQIEAIDAEKSKALAEAEMPIEGLAFDDSGVTYRGIPFKQCSSAEQLRVSLAMAMSLNPAIRVIRISDGSLLDSENMNVIAEMADAQDYQIWVERVDESGQVGFIIEDGSVVNG